ncbi:hypothetical protein BMR1_02g02686 [Babesia microti strain RI]|uniref:Uncharacterized protein n=1 Tax=Babesia microti (strain RI) TaxID=1133968 RepID=A0A1R4AAL2_BABMR|nr:hypothetical protein BMR1_02g02686 [Babesia microti strain RI]SJK86030.1 hypothetical protein BMR1_02g02686 [Babesia microti strain RI]|eukprot:XP_021338228.1 hypothetical protein BMR1_02g02686 [Babesia microti strain RI]
MDIQSESIEEGNGCLTRLELALIIILVILLLGGAVAGFYYFSGYCRAPVDISYSPKIG